jgi:uncharacterized RDD family membrane protein YckC
MRTSNTLKRILPGLLLVAGLIAASPVSAQDQNPSPAAKASEPGTPPTAEAADPPQPQETTRAGGEVTKTEQIDWGPPLISIGKSVELKAGQTAEAVVVIGGSAKIRGKVHQAAVAVGGDLDISGEVGDAAVAVFGSINARPGSKVKGDAVAVGGEVDVAEGGKVNGMVQNVPLPGMRWLGKYFTHCVLLLRPLAPEVGWIWIIAGIWFLFYLLVAALFPRPIEACVNELRRRPASTFLMGLLTKILLPVAFVILSVTGVGILVIPFLVAAMVLGAIVGRIAVAEWIGFKLGHNFGGGLQKPLVALLLGGVVIAILYMIPVLGLLTMLVVSVWGLGCAVTAAFGGLRREMPEKPAEAPTVATAPAMAFAGAAAQPAYAPPGGGFSAGSTGPSISTFETTPAVAAAPQEPPALPEALSQPRATFWERLGAGFLDLVLVGILSSFAGSMPLGLVIALAYFSGMWAWKGTTVGGIVLGLKVARLDGGAVTFTVALVRALAAGFSIVVLFLGFLWIAWDREKQGWHDRIAGTVVVRLPRGTPLVCI